MPESPVNQEDHYLDWKGWTNEADFARIEHGNVDYFEREVRGITKRVDVRDVLEVGYGQGQFLGYCRDRGWNVTGVELLPELVAAARKSGFEARLADEIDDLPASSFDLIAAFDVFEHIPPEESEAFLTTLRDKLRPGGRILLRFPNADSWIGAPFQNGDPTHVNAIGSLKLTYYATVCGLEVSEFRGAKRRGFRTSLVHGLHRITAGVLVRIVAGVAKVLYFPDVRVVLSASNVVAILSRTDQPAKTS